MIRTFEWINETYPSRFGEEFEPFDLSHGNVDELEAFVSPRHEFTDHAREYGERYLLAQPHPIPIGIEPEVVTVEGMKAMHDWLDPTYVLLECGFLGIAQGPADDEQVYLDLRTGKVVVAATEEGWFWGDDAVEELEEGRFSVFGVEHTRDSFREEFLEHAPDEGKVVVDSVAALDDLVLTALQGDEESIPGTLVDLVTGE